MKLKATTAIILDTRREKKDKTFPIKIRVTYNQSYRRYGTKYSLDIKEYKKLMGSGRKSDKISEIKKALTGILKKANDIIDKMDEFTFKDFENLFLEKRGDITNIINAFDEIIVQKRKDGQISTAIGYEYAKKSLQGFEARHILKEPDEITLLHFKKITVSYLKEYDKWMRENGKSTTSIGMYLRNVRHLVKNAVKSHVIKQSAYPFGQVKDGKYTIPTTNSIKKALSDNELKKLFEYEPEPESSEHLYFDIWWFSYLCNGMNIKDIIRLKYSNIEGESITFVRAKTERTTNLRNDILAVISPRVKQIIEQWGTKPVVSNNYIFPFLTKEMTPEQQHKAKAQVIKQTNRYIKRVAVSVGIDANVTTYVARHSYTSKLLREGVSIEFLRQQLGHTDSKTTLIYAGKIDFETKKETTKQLTNF